MKNSPFVSVIIPCYQERDFIEACLDSLVAGDYPSDRMEIIVADGGSTDGTREKVASYGEKYPFIRLMDNPGRFAPHALNAGIRAAAGGIIVRCDAHSCYGPDYIGRLVEWLRDDSIGSAGGVWINSPASPGSKARGIARALESPFCVGPNRYRTGAAGPMEVDTVPFGAWRREVFDRVGFFDEELVRAQDLEFNLRLRKAGYKIILDPRIKSRYYPRDSFGKLFRMMYQYGYWKNLVNRKCGELSSLRQLFPPLFVLYLLFLPLSPFPLLPSLAPLLVYLASAVFAAAVISERSGDTGLLPCCAWTFVASHIGYGAGYLRGFADFFILGRKKSSPEEKITR